MTKDISVVIPTFNRAAMLQRVLDSLTRQSISRDRYEVIVVDDGSSDDTSRVCEELAPHLSLTYLPIDHGGISAAKNAGLAAATAPIVLFFDDDDVADVTLLGEHLRTHSEYPEEDVAVLGFTTWHPLLTVTPFMEWLTDVGQFLLAYQGLVDGSTLPYTYFWGGRSSCKASLLAKHGAFDERFTSIVEDIELSYRLSRQGLRVVFNKRAASYIIRPMSVDAHLKRCERAGEALALFSRLHPEPAVAQYCKGMGATLPWDDETLDAQVRKIAQLESELNAEHADAARQNRVWELWDLYWWALTGTTARAFAKAGGRADADGVASSEGDLQQRLWSTRHRRAGELMAELRTLRLAVAHRDQNVRNLQAELHRKVSAANEVIHGLQEELQAKIGERDRTIFALRAELEQKVDEAGTIIRSQQEELQSKVGDRDQTILALRAELFKKVEERDVEIRRLQRELESFSRRS